MTSSEVAYCTREDVQRALNIADNPRLNAAVDRAILAGARDLEGTLHRRFYPETKTVLFDQPTGGSLWLYELELAAAPTQILSGGVPMTVGTDVFLRPKSGPPYRWLEASASAAVFWQSINTPQAAISITGDYNWPVITAAAGTLGLTAGSGAAQLILNDSSVVGVGSLILIDTERLIVTEKTMSATGATLSADLGNVKSNTAVTVSDGTLIHPGETVLVDAERMYVQYVTGNTLTVERAVAGSALAAHTNTTAVYAPRTATASRGQLGTTAASHSSGAAISLLLAPSLVREANLALAINNIEQALSAYARPVGAGDNQRDSTGRGVQQILDDTYTAFGRKARGRAV